MDIKAKYNTRQKQEILNFLESKGPGHFTVADLDMYFKTKGIKVGTTTIYRQLDKLISEGVVKKYNIDETSSACYEYIGQSDANGCQQMFHLKCEKCGKIIHLECHEVTLFEEHIAEHHGFKVDPMRTVFYGICKDCAAL